MPVRESIASIELAEAWPDSLRLSDSPPAPADLVKVRQGQMLSFRCRHWAGLALMLCDALALQISVILGLAVRFCLVPLIPVGIHWRHYGILASLMLLVPLAMLAAGLYPGYGLGRVNRLRRRTITLVSAMTILVLWQSEVLHLFVNDLLIPRLAILATMLFAVAVCPLFEWLLVRRLADRGLWGSPAVVIGDADAAARIVHTLRTDKARGWVPVAVFTDSPDAPDAINGVPVLRPLIRVKSLTGAVPTVILAAADGAGEQYAGLASRLNFKRVVLVPNFRTLPALGVRAREMGGIAALEINKSLLRPHNLVIKRCLDLLAGAPLFIAAVPILAVMASLVKIVSPGPAFFPQERIGWKGMPFKVWKLRTMYPDADKRLAEHLRVNPAAADEWNRFLKLKNDPRILPVIGQFLRHSSLDELPQLWNVLRGQMSLIGPRPLPFYHMARFRRDFRGLRQRVWPGMSGLWQIEARSSGDLAVQQTLDTYYIRNWSIWLDLYILTRTIGVVVSGRGAC